MKILLAMSLALLGCAHVGAVPLRPCLPSPPPAEAKLITYGDPESVHVVDQDDKDETAVQILVDPASMESFADYLEELQRDAAKAATCHE